MFKIANAHFVLVLVVLASFAAFLELGRMDVWSDNEGQRTAPPAEMLRSGRFVIPTINGVDYLAKPPLLYWAIAVVYKVTGSFGPLAARTPTALGFILLVLATYWVSRRFAGEIQARWASLAILTTPYMLERTRFAELDIPLVLFTFLAMVAFYAACNSEVPRARKRAIILGGLSMAAAIMLKGPVPFIFMGTAWIAIMLAQQSAEQLEATVKSGFRWSLYAMALEFIVWIIALLWNPLGFPFALAIAVGVWFRLAWIGCPSVRTQYLKNLLWILLIGTLLITPWAIAVLVQKGWPYINELLRGQVVDRTYSASRINGGTPIYYVKALPVMLLPWGLLLLGTLNREFRSSATPFARFSSFSGWISILVFSLIAGKEYEYILPCIPLVLIALACRYSDKEYDASVPFYRGILEYAPLPLAITCLAMLILSTVTLHQYPALLIECLVLSGIAGWLTWRGWNNRISGFAVLAGTAYCALLAVLLATRSFYYAGDNSIRDLATVSGQLARAGYTVESSKMYPAMAYYAGTPIKVETEIADVKTHLLGTDPYFYITRLKELKQAGMSVESENPKILMGPFMSKGFVLIGNKPLPDISTVPPAVP